MAKIIFHAGMGKAGSSSIQQWLREQGRRVLTELDMTLLVSLVDDYGQVRTSVHTSGTTNSSGVMRHCVLHPGDRQKVLDTFFAQLDRQAHRWGDVLLSSEAASRAFALKDDDFLKRLDALASDHQIHVVYYVRPQHAALESGWRHWRSDREQVPSEYLSRYSRELNHFETLTFLRETTPRVKFEIRPFRRDLLTGGSVVSDFACSVLGLEPDPHYALYWENRGVPLDVANALAFMPQPAGWPPSKDHMVLEMIKGLVAETESGESQKAALSHLVLQQACHERFETDNRKLINALRWRTDEWVPPVDGDLGDVSFDRLNELWEPTTSRAEMALLNSALARLLRAEEDLTNLRSRPSQRAARKMSRGLRRLSANSG